MTEAGAPLAAHPGLARVCFTGSMATGRLVRAGLFTSDELPWITAIDDPWRPVHYATVNLRSYLGRGLDKRWVSVSTAQTGDTEDFRPAGRALGAAIAASGRSVLLIASGALSHTFSAATGSSGASRPPARG